jgi:hypothetical protein
MERHSFQAVLCRVGDSKARETRKSRTSSAKDAATDARDHLSRALKQAFPLPDSGMFNDLLDAINARSSSLR